MEFLFLAGGIVALMVLDMYLLDSRVPVKSEEVLGSMKDNNNAAD